MIDKLDVRVPGTGKAVEVDVCCPCWLHPFPHIHSQEEQRWLKAQWERDRNSLNWTIEKGRAN